MTIHETTGRIIYFFMRPFLGLAMSGKPRARVLIKHGQQVLLVRSWLGEQEWSLPGGGIKKNEKPEATLIRELAEELGLDIHGEALEILLESSYKQATAEFPVTIYSLNLSQKPLLAVHRPEILEAEWLDVASLPSKSNKLVSKALGLSE